MEIFTTEPGIQFYGGNFMDGSDIGKYEKKFLYRESFALETQHYPDSPNTQSFPNVFLSPLKHINLLVFTVLRRNKKKNNFVFLRKLWQKSI